MAFHDVLQWVEVLRGEVTYVQLEAFNSSVYLHLFIEVICDATHLL